MNIIGNAQISLGYSSASIQNKACAKQAVPIIEIQKHTQLLTHIKEEEELDDTDPGDGADRMWGDED